jgi:hypothetical protein
MILKSRSAYCRRESRKNLVGKRMKEKGKKLPEQLFYQKKGLISFSILPSGQVFRPEGRVSTLQRLSL